LTRHPAFARLVLQSRLGEIAAALLDATQVNFFYDHLFVKEPGTWTETFWHIDADYHPVAGGQHLTLWIPFDRVTPDAEYSPTSPDRHLWSDAELRERIMSLPRLGEATEDERLISWTLEPGDILFHDARAIHGAPGNSTAGRRRALATRWLDQDARYQPMSDRDDIWALLRKAGQTPPEVDVAIGEPLIPSYFLASGLVDLRFGHEWNGICRGALSHRKTHIWI